MDQTSLNIKTNVPVKGMNSDISDFHQNEQIWTFARNTVVQSHSGDTVVLQNEPSFLKCAEFPFSYNGSIKLKNNRFVIFTTDDTNSEIGLFDSNDCSYKTIVTNTCLGFKRTNPIFGASKENYDGTETIYFADGQLNELRTLNLSKVPYLYDTLDDACETKSYTEDLDCNELSFTKKFSIPSIYVTKGLFGNLKNGSYQVAVAYSANGQRLTDYFSVTQPYHLFTHNNNSGSLEIELSDLDSDFSQYQLLIIATVENQTFYKVVGDYNISQKKHEISTLNKPEYIDIPLEEISVKKTYYQKADYLTSASDYLIATGVSKRPLLNYQKSALDIISKYVVYQVPLDYYSKFNNVGYYRDEVYSFSIQWIFEDGDVSDLFHIKGRDIKESEKGIVYGDDVFDVTYGCDVVKQNRFWQIYNTAGKFRETKVSSLLECDYKIIGEGEMAYWESTEQYPDNKEMFGDYSCTPIKHHKFPDESKINRYSVIDGKVYLNILGVKFYNISHPLDKDGNPIKGIVGYKIYRGDRANNRSVISRGIFTNVRSYNDSKLKKEIKYSNYPYNYTKPDLFISEKQTYNKQNGEKDYVAPSKVFKNELTFYSPHCLFDRVNLGDHVVFESSETAIVEGFFNRVFKHPKAKLISDKVLYYAILIGAIDGVMRAFMGKQIELKYSDGIVNSTTVTTGTPTNTTWSVSNMRQVQTMADALTSVGGIGAGGKNAVERGFLKAIGTLAKFGAFPFFMAETAQKVIDMIYNMTSWKEYSVQYNSKAFFNVIKIIKQGSKRRKIDHYQYLSQGINYIQDGSEKEYNNVYKQDNVFIKLNKDIPLLTGDTSQITISKSKTCEELDVPISTRASVFYGTVKRTYLNQYGQLDTVRYLTANSNMFKTASSPKKQTTYVSDVVFGGDCYINLFTVNNPTDLFTDPLYDLPDGFEYDYRNYKALAHPRYWMDTTKYEFLNLIPTPTLSNKGSFPKESTLPRQKYNLDCKNKKGFSLINNSYFYTSINGVFEFIVESDYNLNNRDYKESPTNVFSINRNLQKVFENKGSDRQSEEFVFDKSFLKQNIEDIYYQQSLFYDPLKDLSYEKNTMIYSLPSFKEQKNDNWLTFLSNNRFSFSGSQFGNLTSVQLIENQQLLFLFDKASPYITPGTTELQTVDGKTVYLGDGSLIRAPRPLMLTDDNYGSCQSRFAFNHSKFGFFYPSQVKGNVFQFSKGLDEISRKGMYYFLKNHSSLKLLNYFPTFADIDNPYYSIGMTSGYDPVSENYYLTKVDFVPKEEYKNDITYDTETKSFKFRNATISLRDSRFFDDAGWTLSYSPVLEAFVSFHDYRPVDYLNAERKFMSITQTENNKSAVYLHNQRTDSYCNFYEKDYPHGFTLPISSKQQTESLSCVEFLAESYVYTQDDRNHLLTPTYDKALIYNSEQCSGWLNLIPKDKNNISHLLNSDKLIYNLQTQMFDIMLSKVEQKYRFNQIRDIVRDRTNTAPIMLNDESGYRFSVNGAELNYNKSMLERKKIRHHHSRLHLEKTISGNQKLLFYLNNVKFLNSPR